MSVACQGHAGSTLHVLCYLISAVNTAWINLKFKGQMKGLCTASLLYQPTLHRVKPSQRARCKGRALGGLCTLWPSVSFTFPTGWISCSCGAWHGISQTQTWESRHMLRAHATGLWLWMSPIWNTAVSALEKDDLNFTQCSSVVRPTHPLLLEIPHVFLKCAYLP